MKNLINRVLVTLMAIFSGTLLFGQSLSVEVPRVVEVNENFQLIFSISGDVTAFNPPEITGFRVLAGPSPSTMSYTEIVNGRRTDAKRTSYTYVLVSSAEGKFTIPLASVVVDGRSYSSSPVTIEVVKASAKANANTSEQTGASTADVSNDDIFLRMSVSKSNVVKGESLILTIKLYTRVSIAGFEDVKFPSFNGFWSQEIETPQNIEFERENVNGAIYNSALIRRYMLVPQQTGALTIDPSEMMCLVQIRSTSSGGRSIFDSFFETHQTVRKRLRSSAIRVTSAALPAGAPSSFSGGVGEFRMNARLSKDSLNANDAFSMMVDITGSGNISLVEAPKIDFPADFEVYDVKTVSSGNTGASGTKNFEYPLIPRSSGIFAIPAVEFSYYDVAKKQYITLKSKEFEVKVGLDGSSALSQANGSLPVGVNRQAVRSLSDDVRYINVKASGLKKGNQFFIASATYLVILVLIVVFFFVIERLLSKRIKRNRDIAGVKNRRANKVARARLKNAELLLRQELYTGFYEELHRALLGYVSDKLNLAIADLSKDNIHDELVKKSVTEEHINDLLYLLDQCEYARYAPDPGGGEMDKNYAKAIKLISEMEL